MKTITDYDKLIPEGIIFSIRQISTMGIISESMCKKLIFKKSIETLKIGSKNYITRQTLIEYLEANTIPAIIND